MANPNPNQSGLKKTKKGDPGNPGAGRPKGAKTFDLQMLRCLEALEKQGKLPKTPRGEPLYNLAMELTSVIFAKGVKHSDKLKAIDMAMDRIEGKAKQKIEQTVEDVTPANLSNLSDKDLKSMARIQKKLEE